MVFVCLYASVCVVAICRGGGVSVFQQGFCNANEHKNVLNWDCIWVIPQKKITQKANFYEYEIGLYAGMASCIKW